MKKFPKINSIIRSSAILVSRGKRYICYEINRDEKGSMSINVILPSSGRPEISTEIVDDNNTFINGYKVVQTSNGEYAYIRQSDFQLLPFRYDIASDFNEYGFAMVGKEGSVSWIDTSFRYLNLKGDMVEEDFNISYGYAKFNGWQGISDFSKGNIPLSQVYDGRNAYERVSYFGVDGKFKEFYEYNGKIVDSFPISSFRQGTLFDENGWAMAEGNMLFSRGYYLSHKDLIEICKQKGFITLISEDADKCFDKETGKVLKNVTKNSN